MTEPQRQLDGSKPKTLMEAWQMLNRRTKVVATSFAVIATIFVSWNQITEAWAQTGLPVPASRSWFDGRLQQTNAQLRDVKRKILEGQLQATESSEERIVGEQVSLRLKLPEVQEPAARRIIENRLAWIEIERGKLMQQSSRLRDELQQLQ